MPAHVVERGQLLSPRPQSLKADSSASALSPTSPLSPRSPRESSEDNISHKFSPENGHQLGANEPEVSVSPTVPNRDEMRGDLTADASEASFCMEADALIRGDNAHELAVQRLVEDLVLDVSGEMNTNAIGRRSAATVAKKIPQEISNEGLIGSSSISANKSVEALASSKKPSSFSKPSAAAIKSKDLESNLHSSLNDSKLKRPPALLVRPDRLFAPEGKVRPRPIKNTGSSPGNDSPSSPSRESPGSPRREVGSPRSKGSPQSPLRSLKITPLSSEKIPHSSLRTLPSRQSSRFMEPSKFSPKSNTSSNNLDNKTASERIAQSVSKTDKAQRRVKEFLQSRKFATAFGSRKPAGFAGDNESVVSSERLSLLARENPDLGPFLLKQARQAVASGDNPQKALDFATRAAKSYESAADGKPSLDLVMSLHILAAIHCTLGQFEEAIPVLQQSVIVPDLETGGQEHALAAFAGYMQLGDTFALLGKGEDALASYHIGLKIQTSVLGETDPRVGETCRYLAEAHAQAMQFDKAEKLCQRTLDIHKEHSAPASIEEAMDRRLMGLICNGKGQHNSALEHLVLASMALIANRMDVEVAAVDTSIGDTYVSLCRFDEAIFAYQKALTVFKAAKGENHVTVACVYVSLAELYLKTGKHRECRTYSESALRIYGTEGAGHQLEMLASGLTDIAVIYEAFGEQEQALSLLQKALAILESAPGQQSAVAGVEAQIGTLNYMFGKYAEAHSFYSNAVTKLRVSAEKTCSLLGILLNQMGLCCVHLSALEAATENFESSRNILEAACGPEHPDTLAVYSNLAGAYDAMGRLDDAIEILEYIVGVREKLGTANSEVDDDRNRLGELLKESRHTRSRRINGTGELPMQRNAKATVVSIGWLVNRETSYGVKGEAQG